jgi:hypothetical protein
MPHPPMPPIEPHTVTHIEPLPRRAEIRPGRLDQRMPVIAHLPPGVYGVPT